MNLELPTGKLLEAAYLVDQVPRRTAVGFQAASSWVSVELTAHFGSVLSFTAIRSSGSVAFDQYPPSRPKLVRPKRNASASRNQPSTTSSVCAEACGTSHPPRSKPSERSS
ncbi:hypothetical protein [Streptosporangium sp. NPDC023615]|uniref:hypothetical protein n=1 Tax=Streptosporangium sp. NPDC023615 TaxID=3154794 RepID=UPI003444E949